MVDRCDRGCRYRIVLEETGTRNWKPLYKADRLSQVITTLDNVKYFRAFDDGRVDLSA
jgi:hypothetical protein